MGSGLLVGKRNPNTQGVSQLMLFTVGLTSFVRRCKVLGRRRGAKGTQSEARAIVCDIQRRNYEGRESGGGVKGMREKGNKRVGFIVACGEEIKCVKAIAE